MNRPTNRPVRSRWPRARALPPALAGLDPLLARIYAARGVTDPSQLRLDLRDLAPVGSLGGVAAAVDCLLEHRERRIVVIGDFDADGATGTALLVRCLRDFGFSAVSYLVPNRFEFGYGLTPEIVRVAARSSPKLLVTVDNGISSGEGVAVARALGIEVLITDHHLPGAALPAARAIVNPHVDLHIASHIDSHVGRPADLRAGPGRGPGVATGDGAAPADRRGFASPHLAGVGVAFYLMAALGRALEAGGAANAARLPARYLDLVALGTVADVVPLDRNNRILVSQGLRRIRAGRCLPGIAALLTVAGRDPVRAVSADLGFAAAPRLNAAGRLDDMSLGIECLLADDPETAAARARVLDGINRERREIEAGMLDAAFASVDTLANRGLPPCVCVFDRMWHQGVVGLVAARVRERCHRPVIAFARDGNAGLKGSARSVPGVHVRDLLAAIAGRYPGLLGNFGGHAMAAGLSIAEADLKDFSRAAAEQMSRLWPAADLSGAILTDGDLPADACNLKTARMLREAGPWGPAFPEPVWTGDFELLEQRTVGERHLKLRVRPLAGRAAVDAIAFGQAGSAWRGGIRLAFRLDVNEWRGVQSPQLVVEQISASQGDAREAKG